MKIEQIEIDQTAIQGSDQRMAHLFTLDIPAA